MDRWIRNAGSKKIIQYLSRQMFGAECGCMKSQISVRGSIHDSRSVTFCEKANFMVCFKKLASGEDQEVSVSIALLSILHTLSLLNSRPAFSPLLVLDLQT